MQDRATRYGDRAIWARKAQIEGMESGKTTAIVRLGDRSNPNHINFIPQGVPLPIRYVNNPGPPIQGVEADLLPDTGRTFIRTYCIVKMLKELTINDLVGMSPDTASPELIRYHLASVNNTELPSWDTRVTIWGIQYVSSIGN